MSLDALAPDQRAVVQLVLQQDRSYDELAGLLGISADAVRDRARRGLDRLTAAGEVDDEARGDIADYLLGQQSVSGRERTRSLLSSDASARAWASGVADQLRDVARTPLPEIPGGEPPATPIADTARGGEGGAAPGHREGPVAARAATPPADNLAEGDAEETGIRGRPRRIVPAPAAEDTAPAPGVRARPRPRPERARPATGRTDHEEARRRAATAAAAPATAVDQPAEAGTTPGGGWSAPSGDAPRSSRLGGAILLTGLAIVLVAGIIWLINRDDDGAETASNDPTPTATAEASPTPDFEALGRVPLQPVEGGDARGEMIIFVSETDNRVAFTLQATGMPESGEGEAYAVWLTGGDENHRLGYAPPVEANGELGTSGPRSADQERFAEWLADARRVVVSRETEEGTTTPDDVVLEGRVRGQGQSGG